MGIDAVWIPPSVQNQNATGSGGYAPIDHYDLGDKFQCGSTTTRFGTKDAFLRMVAVLHANGIDVIQDMVWNHLNGAGSENGGAGGQDPSAWGSTQYKNFRYACYATPIGDGSAVVCGAAVANRRSVAGVTEILVLRRAPRSEEHTSELQS